MDRLSSIATFRAGTNVRAGEWSRETRLKEKRACSVVGLLFERGGRYRGGVGWFLLGPIKKPVSSSVSKSLLWHSRQLRKHLKAPEKPDNTSLVECRVPLGGRRDFAPCQRDTLRPPCVAISALSYVLNIECPSHATSESSRDAPGPRKFFGRFTTAFANESPLSLSLSFDSSASDRPNVALLHLYVYDLVGREITKLRYVEN